MTQVCEATGSFLLHQSHPRQPAAATPPTPIVRAMRVGCAMPHSRSNPNGWGLAGVPQSSCDPASRGDPAPTGSASPARQSVSFATAACARLPIRVRRTASMCQSRGRTQRPVARDGGQRRILVQEPDPQELAAALQGLGAQRPRPIEVLVGRLWQFHRQCPRHPGRGAARSRIALSLGRRRGSDTAGPNAQQRTSARRPAQRARASARRSAMARARRAGAARVGDGERAMLRPRRGARGAADRSRAGSPDGTRLGDMGLGRQYRPAHRPVVAFRGDGLAVATGPVQISALTGPLDNRGGAACRPRR